jgi:hypothetical protein
MSRERLSWSSLYNSLIESQNLIRKYRYDIRINEESLDLMPLATLRRDIPGLEERIMLRNLQQNSSLWVDLRTVFLGSSEYADVMDMNPWRMVSDFRKFKLGVYGRNQDPKLAFEIGHMFEDPAGKAFEVVCRDAWGVDDFTLHDVGVLACLRRPGRWSSIDKYAKGTGILPWNVIENFDSNFAQSGWKLTEEEIDRGGVPADMSLVEIKTRVFPWVITHPSEVLEPEEHYQIQVQDQIYASQSQVDWPEFANRYYGYIAKLQPAFGKHDETPGDMHTTLLQGKLWWLHIWLCRYSDEFFRGALPRENYFMESYHKETDEVFSYPDYLPKPRVPKPIYLGSYGLEGIQKTLTVDLNKRATEGRILEPPSDFKVVPEYANGVHFVRECIVASA